MSAAPYTSDELMTIAGSRALRNGVTCFVGIGLPSAAANLARLTHAPDAVLIYESGTIATRPNALPLSIGDGELCETADATVSVPEMFKYWLQGGRIGVGFLGGAQVDCYANLNSTSIGAYDRPKVRLPGSGGAPEIAANCKEILIIMRQTKRAFVNALSFRTSLGHGRGKGDPDLDKRSGKGPSKIITDLCVMQPDPETLELTVTSIHTGVTRSAITEATEWPVRFASNVVETPEPEAHELEVLRALHARTLEMHGEVA